MHRLRWDDLQFVHAVAEHGSLSAASRALGVNHATVLRRIALLEAANDVVLFERGNDGYQLRPEGRALLSSLKLMDHASAKIARSLASSSKRIEGTFRIATTDAIACLLLPGYLASLREIQPRIKTEIAVSNDPIDMSMSGAEILIRPGLELPDDLAGRRAGSIGFGVFGSPQYLEQAADIPIEKHRWLGVAPDFAQSTAGHWQFTAIGAGMEFSANSFLALAGLAAQGLGLTLLPAFVGRMTPGLVPVDRFAGAPKTAIWVATHRDFRQQNHIETLLAFFAQALEADADRLE